MPLEVIQPVHCMTHSDNLILSDEKYTFLTSPIVEIRLVTCWNPKILRQVKFTESQNVIRKEKCFPNISRMLKRYLLLHLVLFPFETGI